MTDIKKLVIKLLCVISAIGVNKILASIASFNNALIFMLFNEKLLRDLSIMV